MVLLYGDGVDARPVDSDELARRRAQSSSSLSDCCIRLNAWASLATATGSAPSGSLSAPAALDSRLRRASARLALPRALNDAIASDLYASLAVCVDAVLITGPHP